MKSIGKVERRYPWIEACLRFGGRFGVVEKKAYRHRFDLTDSMVSRDQDVFFRMFVEHCGCGVIEKERGRLRLADASTLPAEPIFSPLPKMADWLECVLGSRFEIVPTIRRAEPQHVILREVVQGIVEERPLRIRYQPRRGAAGDRHISPHAIIHIVGRLHLRGWDHERNAPRDFVLSRIAFVGELAATPGYVGREFDQAWWDQAHLDVRLRDGEEPDVARPDYNLDALGRGTMLVRKAYVPYLVDDGAPDDNILRAPVTVRARELQLAPSSGR